VRNHDHRVHDDDGLDDHHDGLDHYYDWFYDHHGVNLDHVRRGRAPGSFGAVRRRASRLAVAPR
jgi:hypothetical protein